MTVPLPTPRLQARFGHTPSVMSVGHHGQAVGRAVSLPHSCCAPRQHRRAQNLPARTPRDIQLAKSATVGWDTVTQLAQGEGPESTESSAGSPSVPTYKPSRSLLEPGCEVTCSQNYLEKRGGVWQDTAVVLAAPSPALDTRR